MTIDILHAFEHQPQPLDFVLPGLLAGTVGALISPGGAGKSMLALELAILVASGHDIAGIAGGKTYPRGDVAFLAAEDPAVAIQQRLYALGKHITDQDTRIHVAEALAIEPLLGKQPDIAKPEWAEYIRLMADGRRLLFLDTLRRFHTADENSSGEMSQVLGHMEAITACTGCAIVFLHHSSKSAAMNGQGDQQQASRGSSVLVDNVRWQMYLAGMNAADAKKHGIQEAMKGYWVRGGVSKQNYGAPFEEQWLRRVDGGVLVQGKLEAKAAAKKGGRNEG